MKAGTPQITHVIAVSPSNGLPEHSSPNEPSTIAVKVGGCSPLVKFIIAVLLVAVAATFGAVGLSIGRAAAKGLFSGGGSTNDDAKGANNTTVMTTISTILPTGSQAIDLVSVTRDHETSQQQQQVTKSWTVSGISAANVDGSTLISSSAGTKAKENEQTTKDTNIFTTDIGQTTEFSTDEATADDRTLSYGGTGITKTGQDEYGTTNAEQTTDYSSVKMQELKTTEYKEDETTQDGHTTDVITQMQEVLTTVLNDGSKTTSRSSLEQNGNTTYEDLTTETYTRNTTLDKQTTKSNTADTAFDDQTTFSDNKTTVDQDIRVTTTDDGQVSVSESSDRPLLDQDQPTTELNTNNVQNDQSTRSVSDVTPDLVTDYTNTTP